MPVGRKSDIGGEVTSSSVGANVKILWREEELERVHFPLLQVPWSFVGRLRDEAEKNEHQGMMTVDLAILRQDGVPLFNDDFPSTFREVFVRRFVPCLNEKFNQRDPSKPLTKLPDEVGAGVRLLVLCERLKAALKQDVKDHLDRQLARSERANARPAESVPFKIIQASLELDPTVPPRGTLQERVVHHAIEILANQLPESLDALQELVQLACDLGRNEMCTRLFRATAEKALAMAGKTVTKAKPTVSRQNSAVEDNQNHDDSVLSGDIKDKHETSTESRKIEAERQRLSLMMKEMEQQRREMREEMHRLEQLRSNVAGAGYSTKKGLELADPNLENSMSEENSFNNGQSLPDASRASYLAQDGALALRQGVVMEKVGRNTGDRIVRVLGDTLEWRKGSGRFTKEHTVFRQDVVSIKVVDPLGKTFLLSTKTGLLTLRALSEQAAQMFVQAIDAWAKGQQGGKTKRAPMNPSMAMAPPPPMMNPSMALPSHQNAANTVTSRRFPRISMSFKRNAAKNDQLAIHRGADYSFTSNGDGSFLSDDN